VEQLEASDKTIAAFKDELQNKDSIIESLERASSEAHALRGKSDSLESALFEARVEAADYKKKWQELIETHEQMTRRVSIDMDNMKSKINSQNNEIE